MITLTLAIVVILLAVLFIGTPVAFGIGFVGISLIMLFISPSQLEQVATIAYSQGTSINQLIAPLFILMAETLSQGNVARDIYFVLSKWLRRLKGGLGIAATIASTIFAALCGSSPATAAAIGRISIREMVRHGYSPSFTTGLVAAGGTLGIMIPPSLAMVVFGIITETSIAKLFIAGILPGIMIAGLIVLYIIIRAYKNPAIVGESVIKEEKTASEIEAAETPHTGGTLLTDLKLIVPPLVLIVIMLTALYTGKITPSEVSGIGAIGSILLVILLGRFNLRVFGVILGNTARFSAMIIFLIICGMTLSYVISYLGIAQEMANFIVEMGVNRWVLMILIYILWIILGCLIDPLSMVVLTVPFLFPVVTALGFDPVWMGVVSTLTVEIGMITPPVGLNLFVLKGISDVSMQNIIKGVIPMVGILLLGLALLSIFPEIATFLPSRM